MSGLIRSCWIILFVLSSIGSMGQELPQDPTLTKGQLDNGFTFYVYQREDKDAQTAVQLFVNAGSLQESKDQLGLAHFLEHMAFNGTAKYPGSTLVETLEKRGLRFGSHLNAHTSFDETVYKLTFDQASTEDVHFALDVIREWAFFLAFDSLEVEQEKGIILEEWRSKQNEDRRLSESYLPLIFRDSRYSYRQPIGDMTVVQNVTPSLLQSFYRDWYRPELLAVAVVTPHDSHAIVTEIKRLFSNIDSKENQIKTSYPERVDYMIPSYQDTLISIQTADHLTSVELSYFNVIDAHRHISDYPSLKESVFRTFFNGLSSARFSKIVQQGAPFRTGSTSISNFLVHHDVMSGSAQLYGEEIQEGIESYWTERKRLFDRGFTAREIDDFKRQYVHRIERAEQSSQTIPVQTILDRLKDDFIQGNTVISQADRSKLALQVLGDIDSLSLLNFANNERHKGNMILMVNAPTSIANQIPTEVALKNSLQKIEAKSMMNAWEEEIEEVPNRLLTTQPTPGEIAKRYQIDSLDVTVWELTNGAKVYFKATDFREDYITMSAFRPGGIYALDPADYLAANHVRGIIGGSGAGQFSRTSLSEYLQGNSASATMVISENREGVAASADLKDAQTMFELMYLKWTQPKIDSVVFLNTKRQLLSSTRLKPAPSATYLLNERIHHLLRDGQPQLGDITVERIQQELTPNRTLDAFRSRFDGADGFHFIIVGDYDLDSIQRYVLRYIGGLPDGNREVNKSDRSKDDVKEESIPLRGFGGEEGKAMVQLYLQSEEQTLQYPDLLVQKALEEVLKVRLRQKLRDENSGVYSVGVSVSSANVPDALIRTRISFSCDIDRYPFLIGQVHEVFKQMMTDPAHIAPILTNVKLQMANAYQKESQRNTFWTSELRNHLYQGYSNWLYITNFDEILGQIDHHTVAEFLKEHMQSSMQIEAVLLP